MERKLLVLDANILVRGVFGMRVLGLLESNVETIAFCTPYECFEEARRNIAQIAAYRKFDIDKSNLILSQLAEIVEVVDRNFYQAHEVQARRRIAARHVTDWPVVAAALLLNCPIWTEDRDFFGCGVATWTTNNIEVFLHDS
jgi:predicted nucleic acid-binding protein